MERVAALRPHIVKFDARWIARLMDTRPGFALLKVMVGEFSARGIGIVFEGIEESRQLELAEKAGADMVQGFVLARPEVVPFSFAAFAHAGQADAPRPPGGRVARGAEATAGHAADLRHRPFGRRGSG